MTFIFVMAGVFAQSACGQRPSRELVIFRSQLQELKELHYQDSNPTHTIKRYEQLIANFSEAPEVTEAMYHLARYYRSKGISKQKAIYWFREAIARSAENSWVWSKARIGLAGQLRWMTDNPQAVREARVLVEEVAANNTNQIAVLVSVEFELMMQCIVEDNSTGAERHCSRLLGYDDRQTLPAMNPLEEKMLKSLQSRSVDLLMHKVSCGPGTREGKAAWVEQFEKKHPGHEWLGEPIRQARVRIDDMGNTSPEGAELLTSKRGSARTVMIFGNLLAVVVLCAIILRKRLLRPAGPA
ncbi:tetratricopeptide repeat protein [Lacipirellula parvula]|uniref:tetratricopeptide repeat protein n=1 Tax=Lacipirellula parvula TaxID=2650471 RepID=UPI0012608CBF|nr:tetratricopeptide repeat protein [Lacipirellula parvula]